MKYGMILGLFALVLLATTVFAAAPTLSPITASPFIVTDRNYSNWTNTPLIPGYISLSSLVTGADLNDKNCWYSLDAGMTWDFSIVDMNTDTNIFEVNLVTAGENIKTFGLKCTNNTGEESTAAYIELWLDANAPTVSELVIEFDSQTNINLLATDHATQTGDGVGVEGFYYKIDNGSMFYHAGASNNLQYSSPTQSIGAHTLKYYVLDNFDNNTGWITINFNIRGSAPVFTGNTTATRQYVVGDDRTYYDFNVRWLSGTVTDVDNDLNTLSCEASYNDGFTWSNTIPTVDYNTDVNKCQSNLNYEWGNTGWVQVKFRISDNNGLRTTSDDVNWYLDNSPPVTTGTFDGMNTITLTAVDSGTPGADGVGVKRIWYSYDGGAWTSVATANSTTVTFTVPGTHNIYFYATDNFDNNEMKGSGAYWDKPFSVPGVDPTGVVCNLTMLMMLVLVAGAIISVLGLAYTGNLNITTASTIAISLIAFLIILAITGSVNTVMCG